MHRVLTFLLLPLVMPGVTSAEGLTLVANGQSDYEIVLAKGVQRSASFGARELREYLEESTGVKLPIVGTPTEGKCQIFVGPSLYAAKLGVSPDGLPPESLRIKTVGEDLVLLGVDTPGRVQRVKRWAPVQAGTLYAVYHFLERVGGVRWYGDDEIYTIVPEHERLVVPALDVTQSPSFAYRALAYSPQGSLTGLLGRRWRLGQSIGMSHGHNWYRICPADEVGGAHPEYYGLVRGERQARYYLGHHGGQMCTTHPSMAEIAAKAANDFFRTRPSRNTFSLSPNDGGGFCQCAHCRALDVEVFEEERRKGMPVLTDRMLTFYNRIAEQVAAVFPNKYLAAYIYSYYVRPPKRMRPHPNLALVIAINSAWNCVTPERWARDTGIIESWTKIHDNMFMYDIFYLSRWEAGLIHPTHAHVVKRLRFFRDTGIRGAYLYVPDSWETGGPTSYLMAKLLWNADADVEQLQQEYYRDLYGAGADQVRRYYDHAEACWARALAGDVRGSKQADYYAGKGGQSGHMGAAMLAYEPILSEGTRLLDEAARRIDDPLAMERLRRLRQHHEFATVSVKGLQAAADMEMSDEPSKETLSVLKKRIEEREALLSEMKAYAPYLVEGIRAADDSLRSPLRATAAYYQIAQLAGRMKVFARRADIQVDGDDGDWQGVPLTAFRENMGAKETRAKTGAALAFDERALYVLVRAQEPDKWVANPHEHDHGAIFGDDNIEIFLDTNRDRASYFHFGVNLAEAKYEGETVKGGKPDRSWDAEWTAKIVPREKGWTAEICLPYSSLGVAAPQDGAKWGIELCRTRRAAHPNEYQSLAPTLGGYHQPDRYADLIFGKEIAPRNLIRDGGFERMEPGKPVARSARPYDSDGKCTLEIVEGNAAEGKRSAHAVVVEGHHAQLTWDAAVADDASYRFSLKYRTQGLGSWRRGTDSPITRIIFRDAKGKVVVPSQQYSWRSSDASEGQDEWATHRNIFRTPKTTARISCTVFLHCPGEYWIDDVSLVEM